MDVGVAIGLSLGSFQLANPGRSGMSGRERPHVVLAGTNATGVAQCPVPIRASRSAMAPAPAHTANQAFHSA